MHDRHHEHGDEKAHSGEHGHEKSVEAVSEIVKLRKMAQHWISHNEEHARAYRLWASRAREAGCEGPAQILEEIASEVENQKKQFFKIVDIIESSGRSE